MTFPKDDAIVALHKKYAPSDMAFHIIYSHCQIINEIAMQLINNNQLQVDGKLVHAAAMLHDVGYYPLLDKHGYAPKSLAIQHGITGADILRKEGIDETICRVAERHTGVGLTKEAILRQSLPLPLRDLIAETSEEWLVMYADKLHTKAISEDDPHDKLGWFVSPQTYLEHARSFGEDNAVTFARLVEKHGTPDLRGLADQYGQELK